ncbi:MAG: hypothetical protein D6705_06835 [Deltaproteobacteria bacterium]|nr:MAG: hypothetical protein D6705_06835 [Deltaproteobacteria bacterium]
MTRGPGSVMRFVRILVLALFFAGVFAAPRAARAETGAVPRFVVSEATAEARVGRIRLRYDPALAEEARFLLEHAPGFWSVVERQLEGDLDDTLTIHLVDHAGAVASATGMPRWVAGVARPETGEIVVARHGPDGSRSDLAGLLRHEMAHVALYRAVDGHRVPRWLHEGVAESLEGKVSLARAETLAGAVFGPGVPELADLERAFSSDDPTEVSVAYAAARDFVAHLRGLDGSGAAFRQFLYELSEGYTVDAAAVRAFGRTLPELVRSWRTALPDRFVWYALAAGGGLPFAALLPLVAAAWWRRRRLLREAFARLEAEDRRVFGESAMAPSYVACAGS